LYISKADQEKAKSGRKYAIEWMRAKVDGVSSGQAKYPSRKDVLILK